MPEAENGSKNCNFTAPQYYLPSNIVMFINCGILFIKTKKTMLTEKGINLIVPATHLGKTTIFFFLLGLLLATEYARGGRRNIVKRESFLVVDGG